MDYRYVKTTTTQCIEGMEYGTETRVLCVLLGTPVRSSSLCLTHSLTCLSPATGTRVPLDGVMETDESQPSLHLAGLAGTKRHALDGSRPSKAPKLHPRPKDKRVPMLLLRDISSQQISSPLCCYKEEKCIEQFFEESV
jgi:hypothetical protein